jgi:predicted membrane channel-forming protein YqfA (hemolysin III family)
MKVTNILDYTVILVLHYCTVVPQILCTVDCRLMCTVIKKILKFLIHEMDLKCTVPYAGLDVG